jgi:branched-chain amino acid transport system ATP-binding protein
MAEPLLSVEGLAAGYGHVAVLHDVTLEVRPGTLVALVGSNGAGKSTLLRAISGLVRPSAGRITFGGNEITRTRPDRIVGAGLLHVAEGRRLFRSLTVDDNLTLGLYGSGADAAEARRRLDDVFSLFPVLRDMHRRTVSLLSGGQQQMLAVAQALLRTPRLLMLDEPSLGLAPAVIDDVFGVLEGLRGRGMAVLLVEQVVERALALADDAYVMRNVRIVGHGPPATLLGSGLIESAYLGVSDGDDPATRRLDATARHDKGGR